MEHQNILYRAVALEETWFNYVWSKYSEERFKKTFRISRSTFQFILGRIRHVLERGTISKEPISLECRLAICLYRLARGDYYYTISEMTRLGVSTVCTIVNEVTKAIVENVWDECVNKHMPKSEEDFKKKMIDMEQFWQFPYSWAAMDGCHIPIKCPPGVPESRKEYYNFKNSYSVIMMGLVDSNYGNSHDAIVFQSTKLWSDIRESEFLPHIAKYIGGVTVPPIVLGDSAFPFQCNLQCSSNTKAAVFQLSFKQGTNVTEGCYGQMKGRWRVTLRRNESSKEEVKTTTQACRVLYNICIDN
ncbi:PREDICTED: uncharacterized protein LOC107348634 [Acropora digitifera]|uniref:uncharacterized protein LOC107348634 n=1 Tax=Acropora digitifera TaxID=70779 RepID=UPI00077B21AD|nr:PREDICTED: uncharacterized protein LOC107348634 [Acropora digitifera]